MDFLQKIGAVWEKIGLVQRALLVALVLTFIIGGALLVHWARKPDMRILYHDLSPENASKIADKISERGVAYEMRNGGTSIYVPVDKVYQLRMDVAGEGLATGSIVQPGWDGLEKQEFGVHPDVQNAKIKRALQEELAKSIQMIDGVSYARVHIVSSEQTVFTSEAGKTTASVILQLKPGYRPSSLNVAAITHLVSGSIEGLSSENVTVVDSRGRLLTSDSDSIMTSGAGTVQDYRERVEQNLANKAEEMLTTVLGPGRAIVRVSAVIDMNSVSTVTETYDPTGKVMTSEEILTDSETEAGTVLAEGEPAVPGSKKTTENISTEYEVGKSVKQEVILPGQITSLKVAAFVDLTPADANEASAGAEAAKIMQVTDVQEIIQNALGIEDPSAIKVVDVKMNRPLESLVEEQPSSWPRYTAIARQASLGIMAICALMVFRMFRGAKKKVSKKGEAGHLPEGEGPAGLLPAEAGRAEPLVLRRQIAKALRSNPEQVKQLFASWIEEKGD